MHMISRTDLNSAELETLTTSRSATTVITANGEVQTHEEATVYVKELDLFLTMKVLDNTPAVLSLGQLCDENGYSYEWINGQKPHLIKNGIRIQCNTENLVPIVVPGLSSSSSSNITSSTSMTPSRQEIDRPTSSSSSSTSPTTTVSSDSETRAREDLSGIDSHPVSVSSEHVERKERRDPLTKPTTNPKPKKTKTTRKNGETRCLLKSRSGCKNSEKIWWMTEFLNKKTHTPVLLMNRLCSLRLREVRILVKHSFYTHFPKDRNCEICQRTKMIRAPCRRRIGGAVLRAENFGDQITADHKSS